SRLFSLAEQENKHATFALVATPTRELANQICSVFKSVAPQVTPALLIGGMPYQQQQKSLLQDCRVIVGTPGRLLDFIDRGKINLEHCKFFVLDEADEMFSMGFYQDVEHLLSEIPEGAQGLFVSATVTPRVEMLARKFLRDPQHISAKELDVEPPKIEHFSCAVGGSITDKPNALCDLFEFLSPSSAIVFCNTKSETELVEKFLRRRGFDARRINSDLNQRQRNRIMQKLQNAELRFLVATDIAARGIDVEQIELVVNFGVPETRESYLHRTGRTGRAGRAGKAVTLVSPGDFMPFRALKNDSEIEFAELNLPGPDTLASARLSSLIEKLGTLSADARERYEALADYAISLDKDPQRGKHTDKLSEFSLRQLLAQLSHFAVEHFVKLDAVALEDELSRESSDTTNNARSKPSNSERRHKSRGRARR
ncbi:MAG: DEAD/DEAH box helicase, partial [Bdellovibrionales bacterium]|nr:DEAD/DEAH box helicase [Bdellovibrionales bacterium]